MDRRRFIITTAGITTGSVAGIKKYADSTQPVLAVENPKIDTTKLEKSEKMSPRQEQVVPFNKIEISGQNIDGDVDITVQVVADGNDFGVDPLDNHTETITPSTNSFTEEVGGFNMRLSGSEIDQTTQFEILINVESTENSINKTLRSDPFQISVLTGIDIEITGANTPVYTGNTLTVDVEVFNNGNQQQTETISLEVDGSEKDSKSVFVGTSSISDRTRTKTLEWSTDGGDLGDHSVTVKIPDSEDTRNITVNEPSNDIIYSGDNNVYSHNSSDGSFEYKLTESGGEVRDVALCDSYIAYCGQDGSAYVHNISDRSLQHKFTKSGKNLFGIAVTDTHVAYCGLEGDVYVHNLPDGSLEYSLKNYDVLENIALNDSYFAYGGFNNELQVRKLSDGELKFKVSNADGTDYDSKIETVSMNDTYVLYGGGHNGNAHLYNLSDGSLKNRFKKANSDGLTGTALNDSYVAYGGWTGEVFVDNISDKSLKHKIRDAGSFIYGMSMSKSYVAHGGDDGNFYVYNLSDGSLEYKFDRANNGFLGRAWAVDIKPAL